MQEERYLRNHSFNTKFIPHGVLARPGPAKVVSSPKASSDSVAFHFGNINCFVVMRLTTGTDSDTLGVISHSYPGSVSCKALLASVAPGCLILRFCGRIPGAGILVSHLQKK
jgi:hypothetical protein